MLDQFREPGPHHIVGPCQGCIQCGLIDRTWVHPDAAGFPLRHQTFVHTEVRRELPDTHPLGIAKGTGLSS
ncbi:hypothetical protein GCM10027088_27020 [Nocardia goodfellowii]